MRIGLTTLCAAFVFFTVVVPAHGAPQAASAPASGQQSEGAIQELQLKDGSRLYGYVEASTPDKIVFRTVTGAVVEVDRTQVASLEPARGRLADGEFLPSDPNPTRLFFAPTGRSLRRGEGYVGVYEILLPFVQFGVTDRLSVGAGTPMFFGGGAEHPFWVTPKLQVAERGPTSVAVGILHFMNVGDGNFGIAYAVTTYGESDNALTGGVGYAYARYDGEHDATVIGMIGGERRLGRRVKFVTENYFWHGFGIVSFGVRFLGERLSADVGVFAPTDGHHIVAAPVVNFVWKF